MTSHIGTLAGEVDAATDHVVEKVEPRCVAEPPAGVECVQIDATVELDGEHLPDLPAGSGGDDGAPERPRTGERARRRVIHEVRGAGVVDRRGRRGARDLERQRRGALGRDGDADRHERGLRPGIPGVVLPASDYVGWGGGRAGS